MKFFFDTQMTTGKTGKATWSHKHLVHLSGWEIATGRHTWTHRLNVSLLFSNWTLPHMIDLNSEQVARVPTNLSTRWELRIFHPCKAIYLSELFFSFSFSFRSKKYLQRKNVFPKPRLYYFIAFCILLYCSWHAGQETQADICCTAYSAERWNILEAFHLRCPKCFQKQPFQCLLSRWQRQGKAGNQLSIKTFTTER